MLEHCPTDLETSLRNQDQDSWEGVNTLTSVVGVLLLIRDIQYNNTVRKRSTMVTIEPDFDLYSCVQKATQLTGDNYNVFTLTMDTITETEVKQASIRQYTENTWSPRHWRKE